MANTYEINLREFLTLACKYPHLLPEEDNIPEGAQVVCSTEGFQDVATVHELGTCRYHGPAVQLCKVKGKAHPDGKTGEVYVQPWDKPKKVEKHQLAGSY